MTTQAPGTNEATSVSVPRFSNRAVWMSRTAQRLTILTMLLLCTTSFVFGQADSCSIRRPEVFIGFNGGICSFGNYRIFFNGSLVTSGPGNCTPDNFHPIGDVLVSVKVNKTYQLEVDGACATHLNFFYVPYGYTLEINGKETTTIDKGGNNLGDGDGTWNITLREMWGSDNAGESEGPQMGSVVWDVGLGTLGDGRGAGSISLNSDSLTSSIYTPSELIYSALGFTNEVDVIRNLDESLRQVKAPQSLADIVVITSNEYEMRFYKAANVGPKDQNGLYTVLNQPFVIWRISNPHPGYADQLQISKIQNGSTDASLYTWDLPNNIWTLTTGGGERVETKATAIGPGTGDRTDTLTVKNSLQEVASKKSRTYHQFAWGEELIQEISDPDGDALTTTYTYYENPSEVGRFRMLKSVLNPDGSWEQYDYDNLGNQVLVLRPWKDQTLASASEATSYAIRRTYSNYDGITVSLHGRLVSSVIEKVAGITVRKTTYSRTATTVNGEPAVIEIQNAFASATTSQATITTRYTSSASGFFANRVAFVEYPDGRKDTYSYEKGDYTTNVDPSLNHFTVSPTGVAQRQTVIHGTVASPSGVAFKSTKETSIRDQFGHTVLQEVHAYTGSSYPRIGWSVMDYDDRGQLTQTRRINGTTVTAIWNGDQKTADIDETGIETAYTYDSLNRIATQTKKGIAAGGGFPAQTDIVTTYTYDAEGRTKSETVAAGGLSLTKSTTYDVVGRIRVETDSSSLITSHTYANGGRTETITLPGGATRVTDNYFDRRTKSVLGSAVVNQLFDYGVNADGTQYTQDFIGSEGINSPRWAKTTTDWLGRRIKVEKPSFVSGTHLLQISIYNSLGQVQTESVMAGGSRLIADKLYEYDALGNHIRVGFDVDLNGTLTAASSDRIVESDFIYQQNGSDWFKVSTSKTYLINGDPTVTILTTQNERFNNFPVNGPDKTISDVTVVDVAGNQTRTTTVVDRTARKSTSRTDGPASDTDEVEVTVNGLVQSSAPGTPVPATMFFYDALARRVGVNDPATGSSSKVYSSITGQLLSEAHGSQTTSYDYYPSSDPSAGRLRTKTDPNGKKVHFNYNSRGEMIQTWGDATYPLEYVFDGYGQRTELHTFRGGSGWQGNSWPTSSTGTMDVTLWIFQPSTGLLTDKQDASGRAVSHTYDVLGRLLTRSWARVDAGNNRITATYSYHPYTAETIGIAYSDTTTPAISFTYDRSGHQSNITDAAGTHTLTHNAAGQLLTDQIAGGLLDQVSVNVSYDGFLRRTSLQSSHNTTALVTQIYGYDTASRLQTVTSGSQTATYAYYPSSGLLNTTTFSSGAQISRSYDGLGRWESVTTTAPALGTIASYTYTYNSLDQRTRVTREDNSYWSYAYNDRGELTDGKKYWSDDTPVAGQQSEYAFDNLGNRTSARAGGDSQGLNLRLSTYSANSVNQYQQRIVPGTIDVLGSANPTATVTVNQQAAYRRGSYYHTELPVNNTLTPVYQHIEVSENNGGTITTTDSDVYLPQSPETYSYDADGNLTGDGRWTYVWDAENRLVRIEAAASVPAEAKARLEFLYDWMGRRIQKKVYAWNIPTSSYQLESTTKFIYDGWNLVAELDSSNAVTRNYIWGLGGIHLIGQPGETYIAGSDANQNVTSLLKVSTGTVSARYDYDPFGRVLKSAGEAADLNALKFSSMYTDVESGLIYYGYRYYNPETGSWISRDPIEEDGGNNLYSSGNDVVNAIDALGLLRVKVTADAFIPWSWVRLPNPLDYNISTRFAPKVYRYIHGDGRGPGNPWDGAYRLMNWIEFDFPEKVPHDIESYTDKFEDNQPSISEDRLGSVVLWRIVLTAPFTATTHAYRIGPSHVGLRLKMSGGVPLRIGGPQPPIDYTYDVDLLRYCRNGTKIEATVNAEHDGFPGHELFVEYEGRIRYSKYYLPTWFASEPPGQTAKPSPEQALRGSAALLGIFMYQKWDERFSTGVRR
jgi:RHS repeat-associated protein